jgi:hypothetical protein
MATISQGLDVFNTKLTMDYFCLIDFHTKMAMGFQIEFKFEERREKGKK